MKRRMKRRKDLEPGKIGAHTALPWGKFDHSEDRVFVSRCIDITPDPEAVVYRPIATLVWNEEDEKRRNHLIQKENAEFIVRACNGYYPMIKVLSDLYHVLNHEEVIIKYPLSIPVDEVLEDVETILSELGVDVNAADSRDEELSDLGEASEESI